MPFHKRSTDTFDGVFRTTYWRLIAVIGAIITLCAATISFYIDIKFELANQKTRLVRIECHQQMLIDVFLFDKARNQLKTDC